jgi:hypothetical protein
MALEIRLTGHADTTSPGDDPTVVVLEDDGYYWFLHPFFVDLAEATGEHVDLQGDAVFSAVTFDAFEGALVDARDAVLGEDPKWDVRIGTSWSPVRAELRSTVLRDGLLTIVEALGNLISEARRTGADIVCQSVPSEEA